MAALAVAVASAVALGIWTIAHTVEPSPSPGDAVAVDVGPIEAADVPSPGDRLPPLSLKGRGGLSIDVATTGAPIWIRFWAAGCTPCSDEVADISDGLAPVLIGAGAWLVDVAIGAPPTDATGGLGWSTTGVGAALDVDGDTARALGVRTLPAHVLVGREGAIAARRGSRLTLDQIATLLRLVEAPG